MLKELRLQEIEFLINSRGFATLSELMDLTCSSESTIRADLVTLEKNNKIVRVHGGGQSISNKSLTSEMGMEEKRTINIEEKRKIAKFAASLIENNSIIYLDAGTTTLFLCDYITALNLTIITNSILITEKMTAKGYKVYLTGGRIKLSTNAFIGSFATNIINQFTFDVGFFGANGISLKQGVTTPDYEEAFVKKTALNRCKKAYALCDYSKFNVETAVTFASLKQVTIITDSIKDKQYKIKGIMEAK